MKLRLLALGVCLALGTVRCGGSANGSGSRVGPGQTDAGATDGGGTDAGSVDGGTDAGPGTDGGFVVSECDGLGADPNATSIAISPPAESCGFAGTSDSSGNIALSGSSDMTTSKDWATYDRSGTHLGTLHAMGPVLPRGNGFFGVDHITSSDPPNDYLHLWTFAPDGSGPSQNVGGFLCRAALEPISAAGVLLLGNCGAGIRSAGRVVWYDDAGAQKWSNSPGLAFPFDATAGWPGGPQPLPLA